MKKVPVGRVRVLELIRIEIGYPAIALSGGPGSDGWEVTGHSRGYTTAQLAELFRPVRVLSEWPRPLIADLVGTATRFEFASPDEEGTVCLAMKGRDGTWTANFDGINYESLSELEAAYEIDLGTIVPLVVDPAYIEARR